jgi:RNA polymerase sigma-70 factor (ECF subfamily)
MGMEWTISTQLPAQRRNVLMIATQSISYRFQRAARSRGPRPVTRIRKPESICSRGSVSSDPKAEIFSRSVRNEWILVERAGKGDAEAQEQVFSRYGGMLHGIAFRILRNKEDAEDAVQDGTCRAYENLHLFENRASFSTWLTRIVINSALMIRRRRNGHPEASLDELLENSSERLRSAIICPGPNPERICEAAEIRALIEKQVSELPSTLRAPFQMYDLEERSAAESRRLLGIRSPAFKSRVLRARKKVAKALRNSLRAPTNRRLPWRLATISRIRMPECGLDR